MFSQSEAHAHNTAARTQLALEQCTQLGAVSPPAGETLSAGTLSTLHCWIYSRDKLQVFSKQDGSLLAMYTPLHPSDAIRHVAEYKMTSEADLPHKLLFLISTSRSPQGPHFLLVFNPEVSRVIKAIQLSFPVLAICPLYSSPCRGEEPEWPLSEVSCGLVAVGGGSGLVVLLDLRLDDEEEIFGENTPSESTTYNSDRITETAVLQQVRLECIADLSHPSYILPGMRLPIERTFVFRCREAEDDRSYPSSDVSVSCLVHIPSLSALAVGYNLGLFQLYDTISLQLLFSSEADNLPSPVLEVLYQEPEDDPRDSVYLWVVRGRAPCLEDTPPSHSLLCLYQLQFRCSRPLYRQQGDLRLLERRYSRFLDGGLKLNHFLSPSPYSKQIALSKGTRVISSGVFQQYKRVQEQWSPESPSGPLSPAEFSHTRDLTLCYFVYRTSQQTHGGYRLALFDLNIWYNSQLQASVSPTSRFYHVYDIDSLLPLLSSRVPATQDFSILDLKLTSLQRFDMTPPIPEPFLLPASLSLRLSCLLPSSLLGCALPGEQERVLALTADTLSAGYIDNIESVCLDLSRSGLIPSPLQAPSPSRPESWEDSVLVLLNVSLEQGRLDPVHSCVLNSQHMAGEIPLSLISRWALSKYDELRDSLLTHSSSLLADHPSPGLCSSIKSLLCKFRYLSALLSRIPSAHLSAHLPSDSCYQHMPHTYQRSIEILSLYHEALLWLSSLPPQLLASYRHSSMLPHYQDLRRYHQSPLIVDQLLSQLNTALFQQWADNAPDHEAAYPPPSPLAALDPLLDPSLPVVSQALVLYFLIDLGMQSEEQTSQPLTTSFINNCAQVPKRLPSLSYSFWLIDNGHFKSGLVELLGVPSSLLQLFPFAIASTIEFLLSSEHSCHLVSLLLSVHRPLLDTLALFQLYLQALVKSGNLFDAIKQLYNFFPIGSTHECLADLLSSCDLPALKRLVHTPMESMVLSQVAEFLQNKDTFLHSEILIMLLLKQNRVPQGVQTYHRIKTAMLSQARTEKEKARLSLLDQLVQAFAKTSACDLEFASRPPTEHRAPKREVPMPTPLSTKIRRHQLSSAASQKLLLSSLNDKVAELQQAKFQFEEVSLPSPSQLPARGAARHRYKRLSELTYPSPTEVPAASTHSNPALHRATPLKQAMDRYMNKNSPARASLPPVSLIRLSRPPPSPPLSPYTAFSHLSQATPSSILKQPVRREGQQLTPLNLDFSFPETDLSRQRRARFEIPLSSAPDNPTQTGTETGEQNGDEDIPYHSPLSSPKDTPLSLSTEPPVTGSIEVQPYYSPLQLPEQDQQSPDENTETPEQVDTPSLFQTQPAEPPISPTSPTEEVPGVETELISLTTQLVDRNAEYEQTDPDIDGSCSRDPNEIVLSDSPESDEIAAPALEHSFEPEQLCRISVSANSFKEDVTNQHLNIPDLVKIIPEIEGIERRTGSELRKHFSPRTDTYPLIKYTPFSVDDEKNKIFASLQLGESPFKIASSSLSSSHKESFLPLRSVETTTASYIISDLPAPLESTPAPRPSSSRHKSFRPSSSSAGTPGTHTPQRVPQHHYFTRAKAPSTPDVEIRNSPINFLHTVPVEKQNKPPKVTLFNKSGSLRRSQRLKERSSN